MRHDPSRVPNHSRDPASSVVVVADSVLVVRRSLVFEGSLRHNSTHRLASLLAKWRFPLDPCLFQVFLLPFGLRIVEEALRLCFRLRLDMKH